MIKINILILDPADMLVRKILQNNLHVILVFQTIFQYIELQDTHNTYDNLFHTGIVLLKNLDCTFLCDLIDSFYELQGIVKEEENITLKKSESLLLSIIKKQNKAKNERKVHTSFLTIQQVTKNGAFIGSNRLKHMITAMMELRLDNPKNIYSDRYVTFSKHRRGDVGVKLYYSLSQTGDVYFDEERLYNDQKLRKLQNEVSSQLHEYADKFNKLFNNISDDK